MSRRMLIEERRLDVMPRELWIDVAVPGIFKVKGNVEWEVE